jgi:hypothetical protein
VIIKKHAIRRYKKRIGLRNASKKRIENKIRSEIKNNRIRTVQFDDPATYRIDTKTFSAVCVKRTIVTITLPPHHEQSRCYRELQVQERDA